MNDRSELSAAGERAQRAVRELPRPEPDRAFRERLKRDFVTGWIGRRRALVLRKPWYARAGWRWALAPVAAVALLAAALALNRAPGWTIAAAGGDGMIVVDGRPVPVQHLAELARLVRPGARVRTPRGAALRLASAGFGMLELTPGSDLTVPQVPGRWFARRTTAEVQGGVVRFSTAPAFRGARLTVTAPEARIEVTGTTFAVLCMPEGTCVCVLEGRVGVGERAGGTMMPVSEGRRRELFKTGGPPQEGHILPSQVRPLTALRAACGRMGR